MIAARCSAPSAADTVSHFLSSGSEGGEPALVGREGVAGVRATSSGMRVGPEPAELAATADRINSLKAASLSFSPSRMSMARRVFPSRLELNSFWGPGGRCLGRR